MEVLNFIKEWGDFLLSALAFLLSIVAMFKSSKAEILQEQINQLDLKIKQNEIDKIAKERKEASLSCVEARVITVGVGKYRLKVWNSGNTPAYDVNVKFDGELQPVILDR